MKYLKLYEDFSEDFDDEDEEEDDIFHDNTFLYLAQDILDAIYHYCDLNDSDMDGFVMPQDAINATAKELEDAYEDGHLKEDEYGRLWSPDLVDEFGGYYDMEVQRWLDRKENEKKR